MKTTGVSCETKFGLLGFLGHPIEYTPGHHAIYKFKKFFVVLLFNQGLLPLGTFLIHLYGRTSLFSNLCLHCFDWKLFEAHDLCFYRTRVRSLQLAMLVSNSLTDWLTHCRLVNLIDVTLACEDTNSKLVDIVTVANIDDEDCIDNSLLQIGAEDCS